MTVVIIMVFVFTVGLAIFLKHPKFGSLPAGERNKKILSSPNFANGRFQNLHATPDLTEGSSYLGVLKEFIFGNHPNRKPSIAIIATKENLHAIAPQQNVVVWFGHSSYFLQIDGKKILVDPVLSGSASPIAFTTRSFKGTDVYTTDDIPDIDYLFISHDHWDHLDYKTLLSLKTRIGKVICGLGVAAHLERWGFDAEKIIEKDWNESEELADGFKVNVLPARHFSGRGFKRNNSIWVSFALTTPNTKLYFGGDSGYDTHFKSIGEMHGPFDLAILECGQYDKSWKYIHMMPEEVVQAAIDLSAKKMLPVHWGKFSLSNHAWSDPINRVVIATARVNMPLLTPQIGAITRLDMETSFKEWWKEIE